MKQFIYLDIDIINSIIAQKDKGLVSEFSSEQDQLDSKTKTSTGQASLKAEGEGGLWKLAKVGAEISISGGISSETQSQLLLKEIATKTLHDAAFDIAYEQIKKNYDLEPVSAEIGSFVELDRIFEFVDMDYINMLFAKDSFIDFLKKTSKEKIEVTMAQETTENLTRDQRRKAGAIIKKKVQKLVGDSYKQYDDISDIVQAIRHVIPYNRMLISYDGFLIPLEDNYFRDNPKTMGFKHGGEITCVGYITNLIGKDTDPGDSSNVFASLQFFVNEALRTLLPTKEENIYVVHPVAIYYGK